MTVQLNMSFISSPEPRLVWDIVISIRPLELSVI